MKTSKRSEKTAYKSLYGKVVVYTRRHINGCKLRDPNETKCTCPKWIYSKPRGGKAVQKAAGTPSYTEACDHARETLRGFDPEIIAAREITQPKLGLSIEAVIELYEVAQKRRSLSPSSLRTRVVPLNRRSPREYENGRAKNLSILDFLDRINRTARDPIIRIEQLTSNHLDQWEATWKTNDLTSHVAWRGAVNTFLRWAKLHEHLVREPEFREEHRVRVGNRCGHFDDAQYATLLQTLPFYRTANKVTANDVARLQAFMECGRWAGMAVCDIALFSPHVSLGANNVLTYRRKKSGGIASVALEPAVAARLRSVPPEPGSDPERPFLILGRSRQGNQKLWRRRFKRLCDLAGIKEIKTEIGTALSPHPHALRDSFAIDLITHGAAIENVARALGHATTAMTQKSYLFWVQKRIDHCIEDQRAALARRAKAVPEASIPSEVRPTLIQ
ncbi:MAG: tyrosine-type recombinase/integrase [Candidatus Sulfotelmatobacter sp.]